MDGLLDGPKPLNLGTGLSGASDLWVHGDLNMKHLGF